MSDDIHDLVGVYALGALDEEEAAEFEAHLPSCEDCQNELERMNPAVTGLGSLVEVPIDDNLRARVLAGSDAGVAPVVPIESRSRRLQVLAAAAAVAVAFLIGLGLVLRSSGDLVDQIAGADDATSLELVGSIDPIDVTLSNQAGGVALNEVSLDPLDSAQRYVLWAVGPDGLPTFLGTVKDPSEDTRQAWTVELMEVTAFAISVEAGTGPLDAPLGEIVLSAET